MCYSDDILAYTKGEIYMKSKKFIIIIAILAVLVTLLSIRLIFDKKFDNFDEFIKTRENYEGGTEKFDKDFQGLVDWEKDYKVAHPNATDEEISQAFNAAWGK